MSIILGVDYGTGHIGLALSAGNLAEPLLTLHTKNIKKALTQLLFYLEKNKCSAIVFGLPDGEMGKKVKQFAKLIAVNFDGNIFFQDETLSSYNIRQKLMQAGQPKNKRASRQHEFAAALILQSFLDDQP